MPDYDILLERILEEDGLTKAALSREIMIAPTTLNRLLDGRRPAKATRAKLEAFFKQRPPTTYLYLDERYEPDIMEVSVVITEVPRVPKFARTLYPNGWSGNEEHKAIDSSKQRIQALLTALHLDVLWLGVLQIPAHHLPKAAAKQAILLPYLLAIITALRQAPQTQRLVIVLDARSEYRRADFVQAAAVLIQQLTLPDQPRLQLTLTFANSRRSLGIQAADFTASALHRFGDAELAGLGVAVMPYDPTLMQQLTAVIEAPVLPQAVTATLSNLTQLVNRVLSLTIQPLPLLDPIPKALKRWQNTLPKHTKYQWRMMPKPRDYADLAKRLALLMQMRQAVSLPPALQGLADRLRRDLNIVPNQPTQS
ncbi:DUF3800 domain-containing protein [Lacticaseibacillus jixiensis]|uniref:DUF3800 domain-containing protein n=1 Tax=Lacticaseibacillus jixiensis TaxID=3231926 RepID=UPI0036F2BF99